MIMASSQPNKKTIILFISFQLLLMVAMFCAGLLGQRILFQQQQEYPVFHEAYQLLKDNAIKPLPPAPKLEYGMIRGILQAYDDPFTFFIEPPQTQLQTDQLQGKFGGIGVRIDQDAQKNIILLPAPNSPAAKAGVKEGDRVIKVDDLLVSSETSIETVEAALHGPVGKPVNLTIIRPPGNEQRTISVVRQEFAIPSVTWNMVPGAPEIGVVKVTLIADTTPNEIQNAFNDLKNRGARSFIFDLRDNSGGLVEAGINTARLFLKDGVVIQEQFKGKPVETFSVEIVGSLSDLPIIILVNRGTASSAEIVAGALQGNKRALVIGSPSYGKNSIQLVFTLHDGSSIHVTSAYWWMPSLQSTIDGKGIQPDILLTEDEANGTIVVQKAVDELKK
jgi:carboxyl-terminal processing protease